MSSIALSPTADYLPGHDGSPVLASSKQVFGDIAVRFRQPGESFTAGVSFFNFAFWGAHALEKANLGFGMDRIPQVTESLAALGLDSSWTKPTLMLFCLVQGSAAGCALLSLVRGARTKFLEASIALGLIQIALFLVADIGLGTDAARIRMLKHVGLAMAIAILFAAQQLAATLPGRRRSRLSR